MPLLAETIYEQRSFKLLAINAGYWLAALVGSGILLAEWRYRSSGTAATIDA
jgi:hypothetical protein